MKKISKILAVSAAMVMVLGSTVFAAPSVATVSATASDVSNVAAKTEDGTAITVAAVPVAVVTNAQKAAVSFAGKDAPAVQIEKIFDLQATISAPTSITLSVPGITAGQKVIVLHQKADGTWESVPVSKVAAGSVTATFSSLSPVAVVTAGAAPKTGAALPVAGVFCAVALLGAVVCFRKYAL